MGNKTDQLIDNGKYLQNPGYEMLLAHPVDASKYSIDFSKFYVVNYHSSKLQPIGLALTLGIFTKNRRQ